MHPKAVYLALHGFVPRKLTGLGNEDCLREFRVQPLTLLTPEGVQKRQLQIDAVASADWYQGYTSGGSAYMNITWEEIPDDVFDALPQEMINDFVFNNPST